MVVSLSIALGEARLRTGALILSLGALLGACASMEPEATRRERFDATVRGQAAAATPQSGGRYKLGAPYKLNGVWYVPAEQPNYDEVGLASWYGTAFDHRQTANGETFDLNLPSAAHATLPMPCIVEVTNLENGRVLRVRLNDRGPFHPGRIIDLSKSAAEQLGYAAKGTAKVRVRYIGPAPLTGLNPPMTLAAAPQTTEYLPDKRPASSYQITPPPLKSAAATRPVKAAGLVQAGAFSTRQAAERVAARLASAGETRIDPVRRGSIMLYRVLVVSDRAKVVAMGFTDARAVPGM
jgi:rare lipoprotein A